MKNLLSKLREDKAALGVLIKGGPQLVDFIAQANFDFIIPDMMFSRQDWDEVSHMTRAAHAGNIACFPRIEAFPWVSTQPDRHLAAQAARVLSLQADGVCMSVSGAEEVRQVVKITKDWHRGVAISSGAQVKKHEADFGGRTLIFPLIESETAIAEIDEIIDVEGLTGLFIGWTDFSKQLGHDLEYEHPDVLKVVERIVKRARSRGLVVLANTGYQFAEIEASAQRIGRMASLGVQLIMVNTTEFLLYATLDQTKKRFDALDVSVAKAS